MKDFWDLNLAPRFVQQLQDDGFEYIGYYEILEANVCRIYVDKEAQNRGIGNVGENETGSEVPGETAAGSLRSPTV
jgi:hypothetical protein